MGKAVPALNQDQAVYNYIRETKMRGVSPEAASAVLLLNLVREVHSALSQVVGTDEATAAVDRAVVASSATLSPLRLA